MEPLNTDRDHAADRFALGQMEGQELDDYLAQLALRPDTRAEVAAARERLRAVRGLHAPATITPLRNRWRWAFLAVLLTLSGGLLFWFYRPAPTAQQQPVEQSAPPQPSQPIAQQPAPDSPPSAVQRPTSPVQRPTSAALAANLKPNPTLEYMVGPGQYRAAAEGFRWTKPPTEQPDFAQQNGKTQFALRAEAAVPEAVLGQLQWAIYSNQPADYEASRPVRTGQFFSEKTSGGAYQISAQAALSLAPGLYYFLVENRDSGELYFVGKFVAR